VHRLKTFLTVIGAVTVLVLAANSAVYAATGGKFILGHKNTASKVSTLKRTTNGAALKLVTKSSANAPMTVTGRGKVGNLNADEIDGLDSTALTTVPYVFTRLITTPTTDFTLDAAVPAGTYLVSYTASLSSPTTVDLGHLDCYVEQRNGTAVTVVGETYVRSGGSFYLAGSGSGLAKKLPGAGNYLHLVCSTGTPFVSWVAGSASAPVQFVLTAVNSARSAAARIAPGTRGVH
jgi:hypothetical protein